MRASLLFLSDTDMLNGFIPKCRTLSFYLSTTRSAPRMFECSISLYNLVESPIKYPTWSA